MQCYNNYYMHVAEQLAVKAFLHLNFASIYNCKEFKHYKVLEMNVST